MNQKAQRSEVTFPLLLNLQDDKPHVSSDFQSAEKINSPYLNGMLCPLWQSVKSVNGLAVYDSEGNEYLVEDNFLKKNGEALFPVAPYHFETEEIVPDSLAFDYDPEGNEAKLLWNEGTNTVTLDYKDEKLSIESLFISGAVVTARVRVINGIAVGVLVYEVNGLYYMAYLNMSNRLAQTVPIVWRNTVPLTSSGGTFTYLTKSIKATAPIIMIANPLENVIGVSVVSNSGNVLFTREEGFFTIVDHDAELITAPIGNKATLSETITQYHDSNFIFDFPTHTIKTPVKCYERDDKWWFVDEPDTEVPNSHDVTFSPQPIYNQYYERGGVRYQVYSAIQYDMKTVLTVAADDLYDNPTTITVEWTSGEETTAVMENNKAIMTIEETAWVLKALYPTRVTITYNGTDYNVTSLDEFTITTSVGTTTVSATTLTFPNVFLDDGNMYSFYTIPEASASASSYPLTLPNNCFVVESGKMTAINGSTYDFSVIEAHLVNQYTLYPRENTISVGQNFWASSLKMNSAGVRTPYNIYVSPTAAETFSATVKYTEYTNSNCTDMLYYSGTVPKNTYRFYKYAANSSQDVAWHPVGGYRVPLKGTHWNLLYCIGGSGEVFVQGISYSTHENSMGTLVVPLNSIADNSYIAVADNQVAYQDTNLKWHRVTIKEGAALQSIFDNRFIIVNTTSYWNMWDSYLNKKFHYATDYNGRARIGYNRTEYRNDITVWTPFDRRYFASAINPLYNIAPQLPVSSLIPVALQLAYLPNNDEPIGLLKCYQSDITESVDAQAIDVFYQNSTASTAVYLTSMVPYANSLQLWKKSSLKERQYPSGTSVILVADILSWFINGAGNNDFISENSAKYPLLYNNKNKPLFLYSITSGIDAEGIKHFFVIQGQYYAVIGDKLYSMTYSGGYITQSDAIIDIRDMCYVGNTPSIAFFVNPYTKQIYSFTGDANMTQLFDSSKLNYIMGTDGQITHWYDEGTQSIYILTDTGLLVFGPQNTYFLPDFIEVHEIEFIKGTVKIIENGKVTSLKYYHEDGYTDLPINIETSFWGLGANELTSIDRWNITLYDPLSREQEVTLQVRSLTDVSTVAEEKTITLHKNDWDKFTHSVLISFSPKLIKGQGLRLSISSHSAIQKIVPHVMDNKASATTNRRFEL